MVFKRNVARLDAHALLHHLISDALIAESDFVTNTEVQPSSVLDVRERSKVDFFLVHSNIWSKSSLANVL